MYAFMKKYDDFKKYNKTNSSRYDVESLLDMRNKNSLKLQIVAANIDDRNHGGCRKTTDVFAKQGIVMLSSVLRSDDVAIQINIRIMDNFVEIGRYISDNALLYKKINSIELKQIEYQKSTDEKMRSGVRVYRNHAEDEQKIFFDG